MRLRKHFIFLASVVTLTTVGVAYELIHGENNPFLLSFISRATNEYYHYSGFEADCENAGIHDYYTNCVGSTVLELPEGATVIGERTLTSDQIRAIVADETDERVIPAFHHNFDDITGECIHTENLRTIEPIHEELSASVGDYILAETQEVRDGFDKIYQLKHTYHDSERVSTMANAFDDYSLDGITSFEFYVELASGGTWLIANEENVNMYEMHPNAGGKAGVIRGTRVEEGWRIYADGFKFRQRTDGTQIASYTHANPNATLNDLFHRGNVLNEKDGLWGVDTLKLSEIHLHKEAKCGKTALTHRIVENHLLLEDQNDLEAPLAYGNLYKASILYNKIFGDVELDASMREFSFYVNNTDTNNMLVLNNTNGVQHMGMWANTACEIIVTRVDTSNTWQVRRGDGKQFVTYIGDWGFEDYYEVANVSSLDDIFNVWTASSSVYMSDIVTRDALAVKRAAVTKDILNLTVKTGDISTLTPLGESKRAVGNLYTYAHTYDDGSAYPIYHMFNTYDITSVKTIEFYFYNNGKSFMMAGDDNKVSSSYDFHPSAGGQTPAYVKIVQTAPGTWTFTIFGGYFYNHGSNKQVSTFDYTNRSTMDDLIHLPDGGWGADNVTISEVVITK